MRSVEERPGKRVRYFSVGESLLANDLREQARSHKGPTYIDSHCARLR